AWSGVSVWMSDKLQFVGHPNRDTTKRCARAAIWVEMDLCRAKERAADKRSRSQCKALCWALTGSNSRRAYGRAPFIWARTVSYITLAHTRREAAYSKRLGASVQWAST